jgi:ADP-heptose:LPS heptosyltransferase
MSKDTPRFLLLRFGGLGDNLFLTPVARELHARGYEVDVVTSEYGEPILRHNPYISRIMVAKRFGPIHELPDGKYVNLVSDGGLALSDLALYRLYKAKGRPWRPFNVANYLRIIEGNSHHEEISRTQASNYSNTYDNHLGWAGIDPTTVPDDRKRPSYQVTREEKDWAEKIIPTDSNPCVLVQTTSSSLAKTYPANDMIAYLRGEGYSILYWQETGKRTGHWILDGVKLFLPPTIPAIRCTAALLERCAFAITADTGTTHLAEALDVMHLTYYTFVPAWTISRYYTHEVTVDSDAQFEGQRCKCYQITRDCPRKQIEAWGKLSKPEQEVLLMFPEHPQERANWGLPGAQNVVPPGVDPFAYFKCNSVDALAHKADAAYKHLETLRMERPYCTESLDLMGALKANMDKLRGGGR